MERKNSVYVVGTLREVNERLEEKDGKRYAAGSIVIESGASQIEMKYFSYELTKDGKPNKRYTNYRDLPNLINRRVKVSGDLSGRAFYQASQGQVIQFNEINAGFVNTAKETDPDVATFEFIGYVRTPLHERLDKEQKLVGYEIEIAQANYNEDNIQPIRFFVDPKSSRIVQAISQFYTKNSTVFIQGEISYIVTTIEKVEEVAFGDPIVKLFPSTSKRFIITAGKEPILNETAYTSAQITALETAYASYIEQVERDAKSDNESGRSVSNEGPAKTSSVNRLL